MNKKVIKKLTFFLTTVLIIFQFNIFLSVQAKITPDEQNKLDEATQLVQTIDSYISAGRVYEVIPLAKKVLEIRQSILEKNHPLIVESLNVLAKVYYWTDRYSESESLLLRALKINRESQPEDRSNLKNLVVTLRALSKLYILQERFAKAENVLIEALSVSREIYGEVSEVPITIMDEIGIIYFLQDEYERAEFILQDILKMLQKEYEEYHPVNAQYIEKLATVYSNQGKYVEAEALYEKALFIYKNLYVATHDNPIMRNLYWNMTLLCAARKQNCSFEFLQKTINIEEKILENSLYISPNEIIDFLNESYVSVNFISSLYLKILPNNSNARRLAFNTILNRKGKQLDLITNQFQFLKQSNEHFLNDFYTVSLEQLKEIRLQIANYVFKNEIFEQPISENFIRLLEEEKNIESLLFAQSYDNINSYSYKSIELQNIQQTIPTNTALVELVRYKSLDFQNIYKQPNGKDHYAAYILFDKGEPQAVDLGEAETIDQEVEKFRKYLRNQVSIKQLKSSARELDKLVMQPVRQLLGDTNNILLSPDADLNLIPFEALVDQNNQYLVENYNFTYLTSGQDLLRLKTKYPSQQPPLVIADPLYNQPGKVAATNRGIEDISQLFSNMSFGRLVETANEAQALQKLFSLPEDQIKTQKQATENVLKQVKSPIFLHIATHGFFLPPKQSPSGETYVFDNPLLRSGLVFAGVEPRQSGEEDGIMTAYETTLLNLSGTKLVVLSACDTGLGDSTSGEGIYGLRRALVIAGSESQVISLWKVSDNATKDLMIGYYQNLKAGQGRSEALHEIQRQMLRGELKGEDGKDYNHPYYWASFIPSGDWTPMEFALL